MLRARLLSGLVLLPLTFGVIVAGGWVMAAALIIALGIGGWEIAHALQGAGYPLRLPLVIGGIAALLLSRALNLPPEAFTGGVSAFLIVAFGVMVATYSAGEATAPVVFGFHIAIIVYIGWLGMHLIAVRALPDGMAWALLVVFGTAYGDVGAYFFGRALGRRKLSPRLSPNKTWEGYWGGAISAAIFTAITAAAFAPSAPTISAAEGLLIGVALGILTPLGDLGMSAFKRFGNVKDFSRVLGGHGGMMDRFDTILIGAAVGYYLIILFCL